MADCYVSFPHEKVDCSMCGRENLDGRQWQRHHAVPRHYGGDDSDIIDVCPKCHGKADAAFWFHVNYPFGAPEPWYCKEKSKKYVKEFNKKTGFMTLWSLHEDNLSLVVNCLAWPSGKVSITTQVRNNNVNQCNKGTKSMTLWSFCEDRLRVRVACLVKPNGTVSVTNAVGKHYRYPREVD